MDADRIGKAALNDRQNRATDDGKAQNARALARIFAEAVQRQAEDRREHDGVEQADRQHRPHGDMTGREHGHQQKNDRNSGIEGERLAIIDVAHDCRADEAPDHGATPEIGDVVGRVGLGEMGDIGLAQEVDEEAANADFGADINENADGTEHEVAILPGGTAAAHRFDGLRAAKTAASTRKAAARSR